MKRLLIAASFSILLSACGAFELLMPGKVLESLYRVQTHYGVMLEYANRGRLSGLISDRLAKRLTGIFNRFDNGLETIHSRHELAEVEAEHLDQFAQLTLKDTKLDELFQKYLTARRQALDRAGTVHATELQRLQAENRLRRHLWNQLNL